jgi:hypothetical protein
LVGHRKKSSHCRNLSHREFLLKRDTNAAPLVDVSAQTRHKRCSTFDRCTVNVGHKRDAET